jgi:hypothetical protein
VTRQFIESATIASAGFVPVNLVLEIEFKNGSVYQYFNVPFSVVEGLATAGSPGKYFGQHIRNRFRMRLAQGRTN